MPLWATFQANAAGDNTFARVGTRVFDMTEQPSNYKATTSLVIDSGSGKPVTENADHRRFLDLFLIGFWHQEDM